MRHAIFPITLVRGSGSETAGFYTIPGRGDLCWKVTVTEQGCDGYSSGKKFEAAFTPLQEGRWFNELEPLFSLILKDILQRVLRYREGES